METIMTTSSSTKKPTTKPLALSRKQLNELQKEVLLFEKQNILLKVKK
jgi:hypothetical protein